MKKRGLLLWVCCQLFCVAAGAADANRSQTQGQLEKLKAEIGKLQSSLQQFKDERSRLQGDLRKSEVDISDSQKKILQIQRQLALNLKNGGERHVGETSILVGSILAGEPVAGTDIEGEPASCRAQIRDGGNRIDHGLDAVAGLLEDIAQAVKGEVKDEIGQGSLREWWIGAKGHGHWTGSRAGTIEGSPAAPIG